MGKGDRGKRPYPGVSVSTKLLFYFLIFMMLLLVVLFVFQQQTIIVLFWLTKANRVKLVLTQQHDIAIKAINGNTSTP